LRLDRIAPWIFLHWRAASLGYIQHARRGGGGDVAAHGVAAALYTSPA
jgi:hypothetical protein